MRETKCLMTNANRMVAHGMDANTHFDKIFLSHLSYNTWRKPSSNFRCPIIDLNSLGTRCRFKIAPPLNGMIQSEFPIGPVLFVKLMVGKMDAITDLGIIKRV